MRKEAADSTAEAPIEISVTVPLRRPGRGVYKVSAPLLAGMVYVDDERPCWVQLHMLESTSDAREAKHDPGADGGMSLVVQFRTADHREGVLYTFDATDFLEAVVREHFAHAGDDQPIADPPVAPSVPRGGQTKPPTKRSGR